MKKILLLFILTLLGLSQAVALEYEYTPFVREGVKWECLQYLGHKQYARFTLELKDETTIDGKTYKAMHKYSGEEINPENDTVLVYLREQDKVVYGIVPDGKTDQLYPIGVEADMEMMGKIAAGEEFVLYDFNEPVSFIEDMIGAPDIPMHYVIPDIISVAGRASKRYISNCHGSFCAIEGIGYDGLSSWYPLGNCIWLNLSQVTEDGEVVYRSEFYKDKRSRDELLPLVREGVQWVNERVVINKGDTTRSYYTYEFLGTSQIHDYPVCYSYTDENLDMEKAIVAALFQASYNDASFYCMIYNDLAYYQTVDDSRNMIQYISNNPAYSFASTRSDIEQSDPVNYYISFQKEDFLSRQNFFEVEPVEIDGHECRRYAFVGEDGEPLAYVVEGIGFDSRDMGDLLTPFTRKPDPESDYQEYCGLSHVIKDGKIIYKGMRYREDVPDMPYGDVNGDGEVTIDDVTAMIDLLLSGGSPRYGANITISDVIGLIDMLLADGQAED